VVGAYEPYQPASDVYSFGLMLWELIHCRVVLGQLQHVQAALLRVQLDPASQPPFAREAPADRYAIPEGSFDDMAEDDSTTALSGVKDQSRSGGDSHYTAKLANNAQCIPYKESHGLGSSSSSTTTSTGMRGESTRPSVGDCTSSAELASVPPLAALALKHGADRDADCDASSEAGATGRLVHVGAIDTDEWRAIVELVRQCWEWELEARPSSAALETRLRASVASVTANAEGRAADMLEMASPSGASTPTTRDATSSSSSIHVQL
jgi:hypothetical protein